ncbi:unnamed protein product [Symbiodinium natans]|uniref:Pentatricopeptide repeat-containing protein n=1 Tax=Symbiodinium natans TaxID=878477 RepID=A0A812P5K4_9DINO|nr:unnamed protein product [Symbiodinium natans]
MEEQKGFCDVVTYLCVLDAHVKRGNIQEAAEVFSWMRARGMHRDTAVYSTMIKGHCFHKDLENVLELFHEMREEGVPHRTMTYNSVLEACVNCGDIVSAENIFDQMQTEIEIMPDLISYSTVLRGYCQNGELLKALCMFDDMKERRLRCDELVYNTLMEGCVLADDWRAGFGLFKEMVSSELRPSAMTANILSRLLQRLGHENADHKVTDLFAAVGLEKPQQPASSHEVPPTLLESLAARRDLDLEPKRLSFETAVDVRLPVPPPSTGYGTWDDSMCSVENQGQLDSGLSRSPATPMQAEGAPGQGIVPQQPAAEGEGETFGAVLDELDRLDILLNLMPGALP